MAPQLSAAVGGVFVSASIRRRRKCFLGSLFCLRRRRRKLFGACIRRRRRKVATGAWLSGGEERVIFVGLGGIAGGMEGLYLLFSLLRGARPLCLLAVKVSVCWATR